jgi:hypothetical protein
LQISVQRLKAPGISALAGFSLAEVIIQVITLFSMLLTAKYGLEHNLYLRSLEYSERGIYARSMYIGALMWLVVFVVEASLVLALIYEFNFRDEEKPISDIIEKLEGLLSMHLTPAQKTSGCTRTGGTNSIEGRPLLSNNGGNRTMDVTIKSENKSHRDSRMMAMSFSLILAISLPVLYASQWIFWVGFIGLSSERYVNDSLHKSCLYRS